MAAESVNLSQSLSPHQNFTPQNRLHEISPYVSITFRWWLHLTSRLFNINRLCRIRKTISWPRMWRTNFRSWSSTPIQTARTSTTTCSLGTGSTGLRLVRVTTTARTSSATSSSLSPPLINTTTTSSACPNFRTPSSSTASSTNCSRCNPVPAR